MRIPRTENDGARAGDAASGMRMSMEVEAREKRRCGVGVYWAYSHSR
jgi:hypothetical protein